MGVYLGDASLICCAHTACSLSACLSLSHSTHSQINTLNHHPHPFQNSYEGLTRDAIAHGMGVMVFGNGTGGGFHLRDVRRGDK